MCKETIHPNPGDYIIHHVDIEKYDYDECRIMHKTLSDYFPNNPVITLPICNFLEVMSKKQWREWLETELRALDEDIY